MGNDGGSIPKRRELVKEAARNPTASELKSTLAEHLAHHWTHCPLSGQPLRPPIVSDALGRLFNKDSIIEFLLPQDDDSTRRKEHEDTLKGAVRSLKDVLEVKFESEGEGRDARRVCPVTRRVLDETTRAVYVVPCGHAFSEAAVREVAGETLECLQCGQAYAANDVIPILPTAETDVARLTLRMQTLKEKGLAHSLKKAGGGGGKKRKKIEEGVGETNGNGHVEKDVPSRPSSTKPSTPQPSGATGIKNASTASLTAKVLEEQEARNKKRKMERNENLDSLFSKKDKTGASGKNTDFMTRGFAIPAHQKG